jgi:hypothetical protein
LLDQRDCRSSLAGTDVASGSRYAPPVIAELEDHAQELGLNDPWTNEVWKVVTGLCLAKIGTKLTPFEFHAVLQQFNFDERFV